MTATPIRWRRAGTVAAMAAIVAVGTLGAGAAQAVPGFAFDERISGATRVETAVAASKQLYPSGGADDVVIVSQFSTVDGLTASYLAGLKNAPILYTETHSMAPVTVEELKRLGAKNLWLVGGTAVISQQLEDSWKGNGYSTTRYGGKDRYDTAAKVAVVDLATAEPEKVYIASGIRNADALVVGPIAWARNYPILLVEQNNVPGPTQSALDQLQTPERIVVGGKAVVSDATYGALKATQRYAGADRQETAVVVAENAVKFENFTFASAGLVGGANENAADALVASPLAGSTGTPLLFIQGNNDVGARTADYLTRHKANLDHERGHGYVFGGTNAVSEKAAVEAAAKAQ